MKIILITTGILLSLALGLQTYASGLLPANRALALSTTPKTNGMMNKRSIELSTGIRMNYIETGNLNGKAILFIHGYTDTSRSFENLMTALLKTDPGLRLIAPDLRGHGGSSMPVPSRSNTFKMADFADDILDFMKRKNLAKVDLVGHSMGSMIAQEIALEHPKKVASLTMIGALVNGKENEAIQDFLMPEVVRKWQGQLQEEYGEDWRNKSFSLTPKDLGDEATTFLREQWVTDVGSKTSLLEDIYLETVEVPLATWFGAMEALSETDNSRRMKKLAAPTLIIWGSGDAITTKQDQDRLLGACGAAYRRNATPFYFRSYHGDGSGNNLPGHNMHWGNAEKVALDILEFIE